MKRFFIYFLSLVGVLVLASCSERLDTEQNGPKGEVLFSVETAPTSARIDVSTRAGETPTYSLTIFRGKEQVGETYPDYTKIERLRLPAGTYRFVMESGDDQGGIEKPYYKGETSAKVVVGEQVSVKVTAKLANVRITAQVSQVIKDNFKDYRLVIRDAFGDEADPSKKWSKTLSKIDIEQGRSLYVSAKDKKFVWVLEMVNNQNTPCHFFQEETGQNNEGVKPCSHYAFSFDIDNTASPDDGQLMLNLQVDTWVDSFEEDINISLEKKEMPHMSPAGDIKLDEQNVVNEQNRVQPGDYLLNLTSAAAIKDIKIRHNNQWLLDQGVPAVFEATSVASDVLSKINAAGLVWTVPLRGQTAATIDFTQMANQAPLGEYKIYMAIQDLADQIINHTMHFVVLPDQDHITQVPEYGAKYAKFKGEWCTLLVPDELSFQYKEGDAAEWTIVEADKIVMGEGKNFSARLKGLKPLTKYTVRTYSPAAGEKQGQEITFTTFDAPEIPNMNFDQAYWSGGYWYPNAGGGNSYWATGNDGVVAGPVSMSANNTEELNDVVKPGGKAVRMKSVPITFGLSPVKFAAGSIFTGNYKTDMGNPVNSVKFGRSYTGRPLAMTGYYKYKPQIINNGNINGASGSMDRAHIYISLEDWGSASSRPGSPRVIGYGEIQSSEEVASWKHFYIPITYNDPARKPTHVVLAATASYLGGEFCGGNGSEMLIDEFALEWELDEQEWRALNNQ